MERRIIGLCLMLCLVALAWPIARIDPFDSGWGTGSSLHSGGGLSSLGLLGKLWSRVAGSLSPTRGALDGQSARLPPMDSMRDSLHGDPAAGFWDRAYSRDLRSARRDPSRPAKTVTSPATPSFPTSKRASQPSGRPSERPPGWLPTVRTPPGLPANRPDTPKSPRHQSNSGGAYAPGAATKRPAGDFDGRRVGTGGSSGRLTRPSTTAVPSWSPAERKKEAAEKPPKPPKPPTLNDWLGRGTLKAPRQRMNAPTFTPLRALFPERLPDGRSYDRASPPPTAAEGLIPPDERPLYEDWLYADERRKQGSKPHWHQDGSDWLFHAGKAWGAPKDGRWSWLLEYERRWWTVADGAQRLVHHSGAWWWRTKDGWFLLKDGEPWAWRRFPEWEGHGFIHPTRGTQVVYSADGSRLAVLTPGAETVVFDCATGEVLGRYPPAGKPGEALAPILGEED